MLTLSLMGIFRTLEVPYGALSLQFRVLGQKISILSDPSGLLPQFLGVHHQELQLELPHSLDPHTQALSLEAHSWPLTLPPSPSVAIFS